MTELINKAFCPTCKSHNDGHTDVSGEGGSPSDGDVSMCAYCGTIAKYVITDTTVRIEEFTVDELEELMKSPDIQRAVQIGRLISQSQRG